MLDWFRFVLTAVLMLAGLFVLLVGVVSQYRFRYVLNRMHAASMGDSLGMLLVLTGLCISQNDGWVILKYLLTALFLILLIVLVPILNIIASSFSSSTAVSSGQVGIIPVDFSLEG